MLAADVGERDDALETPRPRRARDPADLAVARMHGGTGGRYDVAVEAETGELSIDVTTRRHALHDFLAEIATFAKADRFVVRRFEGQGVWSDVPPIRWHTALDTQHVERIDADGDRVARIEALEP